MKTNIFKRSISLLLAFIMCIPAFAGFGTTAFAAGTKGKSYMVSFPRENDAKADYSGSWGHKAQNLMNGWSLHESRYTTFFTMNDYGGKICYCIEPGTPAANGNEFTQKDESFWDNYPSQYNKTIDPDTIKLMVGRILQYGFTGDVELTWVSQNSDGAKKIAQAAATQALIWETIVGERDENFNHVDPGSKSPVLNMFEKNHPLRSQILSYYDNIVASVQKHSKLPSFCSRSTGKAKEIELEWNGSQYTAMLTDSNGVLGDYSFSSNDSNLKFSVSGNKLTITTSTAPSDTVSITASRKNSQRKGLIVWNDGKYAPGDGQQDLVSYTQSVNDPVKGYVKIKVSYGSAKIVKTSEDGKVDGVSFRVQGNGVDKTVKTANGGQIQIDNLMPGVYTVTEQTENKYEPQETRRVTIVSGQTATVTFSNKLKRGNLTVTKTSEDGLNEGIKFRLYGTSLSGLKVDEYAVTDKSGKAYFKDVLIGSGYTIEEVDTAIRYVVPEKQTADVEWNKVTNKSFNNILKKWNLTVTKSDSEKGLPQGDASLAGAKYGIYKGEQLIDTYTTDKNGQFTTKYYVCGNDWSLREISPSEGYLLNTESLHIGAEAKLYTAEFNLAAPLDSYETVQKGKIAIIKHSDNGDTQIETPEKGAEFQIYLKSAGSFVNADKDEKDTIVCDEDGFASTKLLPYGVYTVHQTKGWDGREKIKDFDVYINTDMKEYKFLINNSNFESYIKVVKLDAETGKQIAYEGAGFEIYDADGHRVNMQFTYPEVTLIHTFYTNSEGYLITPEKLPYGDYSLVEVQAPYGYVLDSTPIPFTVTQKNSSTDTGVTVVKVKARDIAQKGVIEITKEGEIFSSVGMLGGGYIDENGNEVTFPITYSPIYETRNLANAVFQIYAAEDIVTLDGTVRAVKGELVDEITTTENGAKSKELYLGKYTVIEKTAPDTFVNVNEQYDVELTYVGQDISVTNTALSVYNERQKVTVSLLKELSQDERFKLGMNNEILSVQFGIYANEDITAADGTAIPKDALITYGNCDENGKLTFNCDLPIGFKWYAKEIATDNHYILSDKKYEFTTVYQGQDIETINIDLNNGEPIINDFIYGTIKGLKIDRETEKTIEGALFGLFKADETEFTKDNAILTAESDKNGIFVFENIPFGNWIVKELQPAENYLPSDDIHYITVSENEQIIEITAVNDRIPELKTTATVDGEKEAAAKGEITIEDVVEYKHLIPSKEYKIVGTLMDKSTGNPFEIDGKPVTSEVTFTPEKSNGTVTVSFTFDSSAIKETTELVVFETLYRDNIEIAVHADINDEGQTVTVIPPAPPVPQTGDESNLGFWIGLGAIALGGLISVAVIYFKKKKDDDDE